MSSRRVPPSEAPLAGRRIVVTRPGDGSDTLTATLRELGAEVLELPAIEIVPAADEEPIRKALAHLSGYAWVAFTSRNAVRATLEYISALGIPIPLIAQVAAVGEATARELKARGVRVDCVPPSATGSSLAEALIGRGIQGARILLPAGDRARREVPDALRAAGASVDEIVVYRTVAPAHPNRAALEAIERGMVDAIVLASPSALTNLADMLPGGVEALRRVTAACIGPTTAAAARSTGIARVVAADQPTSKALVDVIIGACGAGGTRAPIP